MIYKTRVFETPTTTSTKARRRQRRAFVCYDFSAVRKRGPSVPISNSKKANASFRTPSSEMAFLVFAIPVRSIVGGTNKSNGYPNIWLSSLDY
jgi:hypothetical protein